MQGTEDFYTAVTVGVGSSVAGSMLFATITAHVNPWLTPGGMVFGATAGFLVGYTAQSIRIARKADR